MQLPHHSTSGWKAVPKTPGRLLTSHCRNQRVVRVRRTEPAMATHRAQKGRGGRAECACMTRFAMDWTPGDDCSSRACCSVNHLTAPPRRGTTSPNRRELLTYFYLWRAASAQRCCPGAERESSMPLVLQHMPHGLKHVLSCVTPQPTSSDRHGFKGFASRYVDRLGL